MTAVVTIVGATGTVGEQLSRRLLEAGTRVRAIGRDASRLEALAGLGAEPFAGDLEDAAFLAKAFTGADAALLMVPPGAGEHGVRAFQRQVGERQVTAVTQARVPRVVTLSSVGAELESGNGPIAGLHELEQRVNGVKGLHVVHLRPAYFMENHLAQLESIRAQGMFGSAIRGGVPMAQVATRDIAAHAATLLSAPSFTGRSVHELPGPRDYTMNEVATALGAAIGRPELRYVTFPPDATRDALIAAGLPPDLAALYVEMMEGFNARLIHPLEPRSATAPTPTTLEEFAAEVFAPAYRRAAA